MRLSGVGLVLALVCSVSACAGQAEGGAGKGAAERWPDKVKEGEAAPDFTLKSPDEKTSFTLSAFKDKKPVVLVFGSFT